MILTDEEARVRECIYIWQPKHFLNPGMRPIQEITTTTCYGSSCVAYWRWADPEKTLGYCSLGGKPEF